VKVRQIVPLAGIAAAAAIGLSACGSYGSSSAPAGNAAAAPAATTGGQAQVQTDPAGAQPKVLRATTQLPGFGPVVVNGKGRTVYRFDKDTNNPPTSNCFGMCAQTWQPVPVGAAGAVLTGIDKSLVGAVKRPDGTFQLTLKGWPLYYYFKDLTFGQTAGQGIGGTWFAIAPDGSKAQFAGSGSSTSTDSGGYTY
jgi:predicted lipoprotein with Yx(FWY)xxD motif